MSAKTNMRAAVFANELGDLILAVDNHELLSIIWDDDDPDDPVLVVWDEVGNPVKTIPLLPLLPKALAEKLEAKKVMA